MELVIPLVLFLIMCLMMIILLAQTKGPTAIDTAEALCDAIIHNDIKTQQLLCDINPIPLSAQKALGQIANDHKEIARGYNCSTIREYDDADSSYSVVSVPLIRQSEAICLTCRFMTQQWTVISIHIDSDLKADMEN